MGRPSIGRLSFGLRRQRGPNQFNKTGNDTHNQSCNVEPCGVQPAVEKKAKKAADNNGGDEDKGQLHGNGSLVGDFLGFFR